MYYFVRVKIAITYGPNTGDLVRDVISSYSSNSEVSKIVEIKNPNPDTLINDIIVVVKEMYTRFNSMQMFEEGYKYTMQVDDPISIIPMVF